MNKLLITAFLLLQFTVAVAMAMSVSAIEFEDAAAEARFRAYQQRLDDRRAYAHELCVEIARQPPRGGFGGNYYYHRWPVAPYVWRTRPILPDRQYREYSKALIPIPNL